MSAKLPLVLLELGDTLGGCSVSHGAGLESPKVAVDLAGDLRQTGIDGCEFLLSSAVCLCYLGCDDVDGVVDEAGLLIGVE
ncbi:MAG TPA: hypothetical protein VFC19_30850 [Candidatus Limnocylindrales bacterium]|nr:hypothetical protein [Candidatus Limnocylindrales bacterium]